MGKNAAVNRTANLGDTMNSSKLLGVVLCFVAQGAVGQTLYKCPIKGGGFEYSDRPCVNGPAVKAISAAPVPSSEEQERARERLSRELDRSNERRAAEEAEYAARTQPSKAAAIAQEERAKLSEERANRADERASSTACKTAMRDAEIEAGSLVRNAERIAAKRATVDIACGRR
jgi:flagellar biosynthesis GTPase FlhF